MGECKKQEQSKKSEAAKRIPLFGEYVYPDYCGLAVAPSPSQLSLFQIRLRGKHLSLSSQLHCACTHLPLCWTSSSSDCREWARGSLGSMKLNLLVKLTR